MKNSLKNESFSQAVPNKGDLLKFSKSLIAFGK